MPDTQPEAHCLFCSFLTCVCEHLQLRSDSIQGNISGSKKCEFHRMEFRCFGTFKVEHVVTSLSYSDKRVLAV